MHSTVYFLYLCAVTKTKYTQKMKKLTVMLVLVATTLAATAQKKNAGLHYFTDLEQQEDVFTLSLSKKVLQSIDTDVEWGKTMKYVQGTINNIKIMLIDADTQKMTQKIAKNLTKLGYKKTPLENNNEASNNENLFVFTNKKGKKLTEAYFVLEKETGGGIFLSLLGDFTIIDQKK